MRRARSVDGRLSTYKLNFVVGPVSRDSMLYIEVVIALLEYIHYNFMYKMYCNTTACTQSDGGY